MDFKNRNKMFLAENNFVTYRKKKKPMSFAEDYTENQSVICHLQSSEHTKN